MAVPRGAGASAARQPPSHRHDRLGLGQGVGDVFEHAGEREAGWPLFSAWPSALLFSWFCSMWCRQTITLAAVAGLIIGIALGAVIAGLALMERRSRHWVVCLGLPEELHRG